MKITLHYLKRIATEPIGLLIFVLFPVGLLFLNNTIIMNMLGDTYDLMATIGGRQYNFAATSSTMMIMMMFQLMGGSFIIDYTFIDLKSNRRWRLLASPHSKNKFLFSALAACLIVSIISGLLVIAVGYFLFDAYIGNIGMILTALVLMAVLGQLLGLLIALLCNKKGTCEGVLMGVSWGIFILSGFFPNTNDLPLVGTFFSTRGTPFSAGVRAIERSGMDYNFYGRVYEECGVIYERVFALNPYDMNDALISLGILAGFVLAMAFATVWVGRRKPL